MTIYDKKNLFADDLAVTATAVLTDNIYVGFNAGDSDYMNVSAEVTEDFATLTSLKFELYESSDNGAVDTYALIQTSEDFPLAKLKKGTVLHLGRVPRLNEAYLQLKAVVTGSNATAGKITAGIVQVPQTNNTF